MHEFCGFVFAFSAQADFDIQWQFRQTKNEALHVKVEYCALNSRTT